MYLRNNFTNGFTMIRDKKCELSHFSMLFVGECIEEIGGVQGRA